MPGSHPPLCLSSKMTWEDEQTHKHKHKNKTTNTKTLGMPGSHPPLCLLAAMTFKMGRWANTKTQLLELLHIQNGYILQQKYMLEAHGSILHILSCCDETSNSQAKCDTARCNMVALPQGMRRASKVSASRPWPWRGLFCVSNCVHVCVFECLCILCKFLCVSVCGAHLRCQLLDLDPGVTFATKIHRR